MASWVSFRIRNISNLPDPEALYFFRIRILPFVWHYYPIYDYLHITINPYVRGINYRIVIYLC
jgi:hypothetical protein